MGQEINLKELEHKESESFYDALVEVVFAAYNRSDSRNTAKRHLKALVIRRPRPNCNCSCRCGD